MKIKKILKKNFYMQIILQIPVEIIQKKIYLIQKKNFHIYLLIINKKKF